MKKTDKIIIGLLAIVLVAAVSLPHIDAASDFVNAWLQANVKASSDGVSLKVEFTPESALTADFATTNTVEQVLNLTRTTTGTPASGIGGSLDLTVETSAGNNETGVRIAAVPSDLTAASEDFSTVFYNMAAGAAASSVMSLGSTGILTMAGGATQDNTTAATELNITETNIQLTGAIDLEGGNVKVNEDSGDYDFAIETDSTDNAFSIDSGNSTLQTNGVTVTLNQGGADVDFIVKSDNVADILKVDAGTDTIQHGAWDAYEYVKTTAQSYSLASVGRAGIVIQTVGAAASGHLMTDLLTSPGPGGMVTWKTGDASDIVIDTEGAETIDGAASYTIDGTMEAVTMINDGSNWFIVGGYLE